MGLCQLIGYSIKWFFHVHKSEIMKIAHAKEKTAYSSGLFSFSSLFFFFFFFFLGGGGGGSHLRPHETNVDL